MKKVVCARCGLVNLDRFVSFPHCAACGALLEQQQTLPRWRTIWRRPINPLYWMLAVGSGLAVLGLALATLTRETRAVSDQPLLVYTQIPRDFTPGQAVVMRLTLDSPVERPDDNFERVSLRLSQQMQRDFVSIAVQPPPAQVQKRGRGRYYLWDKLPRNSAIQLTLQPRPQNDGILQIQAQIWARHHRQFEVRASLARATNNAARPAIEAQPRRPSSMQNAPGVAR